MNDPYKTLEWGWVEFNTVRQTKCPLCKRLYNARLSGDGRKLQFPKHGKTMELECPAGDKWYQLVWQQI